MRLMLTAVSLIGVVMFSCGCSKSGAAPKSPTTVMTHKYRPQGDTVPHIDMTKIKSEELKKVYAHIDEHFDEHVERLQKWIRQPSISNSGEGIQQSAQLVKAFSDTLARH